MGIIRPILILGNTSMDTPEQKGPSALRITIGGVLSVIGLLGGGIAAWSSNQSDIAVLQEFKAYQGSVNTGVGESIRDMRAEARDSDIRTNAKLDHIIDRMNSRR